jgi:hypothetical protein
MFDIRPFVLRPALGQEFEDWVPNGRLCELASRNGKIERRQVAAVEMADEVGRAEM